MPMKKRTEKRLQVEVDKCIRQISLIYEMKHFNDRLKATLGTRGFSRVRRVFPTCKRVYPGSCEVGCRPSLLLSVFNVVTQRSWKSAA